MARGETRYRNLEETRSKDQGLGMEPGVQTWETDWLECVGIR